ncbi:MAG: MauE/DoxX family redox-associated membrane protein [Candidatus Binatia bacterium]
MTTLLHDPLLVLVVRGALAVLFASAAWHKLRARDEFAAILAAYRLLPGSLVVPATAVIAATELGVAGALVLPNLRLIGALGATGLLALYSLAIGANLLRGRRTIDCGCGALGARQPISEWLLVRNALLAAAAAVTAQPVVGRQLEWVDGVTLVGGVAVAACAWTAAHGLAAAAQRVAARAARLEHDHARLRLDDASLRFDGRSLQLDDTSMQLDDASLQLDGAGR